MNLLFFPWEFAPEGFTVTVLAALCFLVFRRLRYWNRKLEGHLEGEAKESSLSSMVAIILVCLTGFVGGSITAGIERMGTTLKVPFPWDYSVPDQVMHFLHSDGTDVIRILQDEVANPPPGYVHHATLTQPGKDAGVDVLEIRWVIYRKEE